MFSYRNCICNFQLKLVVGMLIFINLFAMGAKGQIPDEKLQWKVFSGNLGGGKGLWISNTGSQSTELTQYQYGRIDSPYTVKISISNSNTGYAGVDAITKLSFIWDNQTKNVKIIGQDQSGKEYTGESGKITASEMSFDIMDPMVTEVPSYLRFHITLYNQKMTVRYFRQQADKWVFVKENIFVVMP